MEKLNIFPFLSREENYMKDIIKKLIDAVLGSPTWHKKGRKVTDDCITIACDFIKKPEVYQDF